MAEDRVDLYDEFYGLTDALGAAGIPYAVCGGVALSIHGYTRFTKDIDLLILPADERRTLEVAAQRRFILEGGRLPMGEGDVCDWEIVRVSKVVGRDLLTLDLLLVGPSIQGVWDGRETQVFNGRQITVVSREGLKRLKLMAGRKQDLLDLEQLGLLP
ncbi:MAG: hypothetical protein AABP62_22355 [Planctomycetota bacterium]